MEMNKGKDMGKREIGKRKAESGRGGDTYDKAIHNTVHYGKARAHQ